MPSSLFDLSGKVALVTGASRGIGEAIAHGFAAAGARLVLASRKLESLERVAADIRAQSGEALPVAAHTGRREEVQRLVGAAVDAFGGVDILVNNAATNPHFGPLLDADESIWDKTFDVNVKGYFHAARACAPVMRRRGGGKIVNTASIAAYEPLEGLGLYAVTKAAVVMLTKVLAAELAADNIQVNALAPGLIETRFSATLWQDPELAPRVVRQTPAGRFGRVEDLVGAALYFASAASAFTTGTLLPVDGGYTIASKV